MILYTVMPLELVFEQPADTDPPLEVETGRRRLLIRRSGHSWSVVRLLSTDPADYLDPRFQPGAVLPLSLH